MYSQEHPKYARSQDMFLSMVGCATHYRTNSTKTERLVLHDHANDVDVLCVLTPYNFMFDIILNHLQKYWYHKDFGEYIRYKR